MTIPSSRLASALALTSLVVACDPGPAPTPAGAFEACGTCEGALECIEVRYDQWLFDPDFVASQCTLRCGRDETCTALHPAAYCSTSDVCALPCADDSECPGGATCQRGACLGGPGDGAPAQILEPGPSRLATGADVTFMVSNLPCAAGSITYEVVPAGVLEVSDLVYGVASGGCTLDAHVRALAVGSAAIVVRDAGRREVSRHEITVEDPTAITIGDFLLFDDGDPLLRRGDLDEIVLGATTDPLGLIAIGRDGADARLALGAGATWSIDDEVVASVEAWGEASGDSGFAFVTPHRAGETTLRIMIGDHERTIPVRVVAE